MVSYGGRGEPAVLAIMARFPAIGQVKTRLARKLGPERAYELYRAFVDDLDGRYGGGRRPCVWAFWPPQADFGSVVRPGSRLLRQEGRDLGERMHNVFRRLCGEGHGPVLLIGADVPHVRDEWLDEAARRLAGSEVVLGPTRDGGYYLIGMRHAWDLFRGVAMGTPSVLQETLRKASAAGLRVHLLPETFDVDEVGDVDELARLLSDDAEARRLPATARCLLGVGGRTRVND